MNEREINEAISAWFEPKPTEAPSFGQHISPKSHWWFRQGEWHHESVNNNFFHSEEANARLLEAMPNVRLTKDHGRWECESDWRYFHTEGLGENRKTAVVLAFCQFAGIDTGERRR